MLITNHFVTDLSIALITLFIVAFVYIKYKYRYWTRRGVPQLPPTFPFGNYFKGLPRGISLAAHSRNFYDAFKKSGVKLGGVYLGVDPYLVIVDPVYVTDVFVKDFQYFVNRGIYSNKKNPITVSIFTQEGDEWRNTRKKFSSMFTSSKTKFFFNTVKECSNDMKVTLDSLAKESIDVDMYDVMARYFTDIIGSVVFGVEAKSFTQPDATFPKLGKLLFETFKLRFQLPLFLSICYPKVAKMFSIGSFQPEIEKFFFDFVSDTFEYRIKNNIYRADFLQLLIELKNTGAVNLTMEEMVAQCFLFWLAGFETSSSSSTFAMLELGLNQEIQNKVRKEIETVLEKHNGDFTYDSLLEMTYLNQVVNESLRKYPQLTTITRVCVKDYKFPNSDVVIEKNTGVIFPVLGYHSDPNIFPDPMKWDPDRFEDKNVKYEGYLPFGDGPRNCIGGRFGLMQVKLGIAEIVRNYQIFVSPNTKLPLEYEERAFATKMKQKVYLRIKKIC